MMEANPLESVREQRARDEGRRRRRRRVRRASASCSSRPTRRSTRRACYGQSKALCEWIVEALRRARRRRDALRRRALRQRARLVRHRDPDLPAPDRAGRAGHGHAPGDDALLHDDPRGGRAGRSRPARSAAAAQVFVLDMGEPVRIVDLAHNMIRLSGKEPEREIQISSSASRPARSCTRSSGATTRSSTDRASEDLNRARTSRRVDGVVARGGQLERGRRQYLAAAGGSSKPCLGPSAAWPPRAAVLRRRALDKLDSVSITELFTDAAVLGRACRTGVDVFADLNPAQRRAVEATRGPGLHSGRAPDRERRRRSRAASPGRSPPGRFAPTRSSRSPSRTRQQA